MFMEMKPNETDMMSVLADFIRIRTAVDRAISPISQEYGLTPLTVIALHVISCQENPTVSELFRSLELNQGNVSSMCKRLEEGGFIIRRRVEADERRRTLEITEKGRNALDMIGRRITAGAGREKVFTDEEFGEIFKAMAVLCRASRKLEAVISSVPIEQK